MSSTLSRRSLLALTPGLLLAACESDDIARRSGRRVYTRPRFSGRVGQQIELNKALLARGMALGNPVLIQVFKEERQLDVWMLRNDTSGFALMNRYPICYYSGQLGPKLREEMGSRQRAFTTSISGISARAVRETTSLWSWISPMRSIGR